jgi:hypothetical protein
MNEAPVIFCPYKNVAEAIGVVVFEDLPVRGQDPLHAVAITHHLIGAKTRVEWVRTTRQYEYCDRKKGQQTAARFPRPVHRDVYCIVCGPENTKYRRIRAETSNFEDIQIYKRAHALTTRRRVSFFTFDT